jgi:hypothetical protein
VDSAAVGARVPVEPAAPVRARRVLVRQPVLADLPELLAVLVPAHLAVLVQRPVPADPEERAVLLADLVLDPAVQVELLHSRPSFSPATARSTP